MSKNAMPVGKSTVCDVTSVTPGEPASISTKFSVD